MIRILEELGEAYCRASVVTTGGPERVVDDGPDPNFKPRPVGFTARMEQAPVEPLTWEGDNA